eukprot:scaffold20151_cov77-Skeletonema_dohrnii-CCMP3373.AAC.3
MFTDHNKAKVEGNKPKVSVPNQITAALPKVSFNNEVLSGRRKAPTNIENNVYPNKKVKVDNDAKVDKLDRIIATSIKITAMAPSSTSTSTSTSTTSTSFDDALNDCVLSVNDSDVLCGRGKGKPHNHVGNINYRDLVAANQDLYLRCHERDKKKVSRLRAWEYNCVEEDISSEEARQGIVAAVRNKGGRFLKYDKSNKIYVDIGDKKASAKTSQTLRDALNRNKKASRFVVKDQKEKKELGAPVPVKIDTSVVDWTKELPQEWYTDYSTQVLGSFMAMPTADTASQTKKKSENSISSFSLALPYRTFSNESYLEKTMPTADTSSSRTDREDSNLSSSSGASVLSGSCPCLMRSH